MLVPPTTLMTFGGCFVFLSFETLFYAGFQPRSNLVCPPAQSPVADAQGRRHLLVVLDLVVSFVEVIVKDEVAFFGRQNPQTGMQAFAFATDNRIHEERYR